MMVSIISSLLILCCIIQFDQIINAFVTFFSDFVIVKCNLLCRENAHFHCCYCPATVLRKVQLITHLQKCKKKLGIPGQEAQSPLLHSPAATAPLPTISAQTSHVITQVPSLSCPMSIRTSSSPVFQSPPTTQSWTSPLCQPLQPGTTCPLSEASFSLSASTQVFPSPTISSVHVPPEQPTINRPRAKNRIRCDYCDMELNKKNLRVHIRRKHTKVKEAITLERHLLCQCIDSKHGIFAVAKSFSSPSLPIHVQKGLGCKRQSDVWARPM